MENTNNSQLQEEYTQEPIIYESTGALRAIILSLVIIGLMYIASLFLN